MIKKIAIIGISAVLLGGCTFSDILKTNDAAQDQAPPVVATNTPLPTSTDTSLQAIPSTSTSSDVDSLEIDISNTKIIDEDLSNLN